LGSNFLLFSNVPVAGQKPRFLFETGDQKTMEVYEKYVYEVSNSHGK